MKCWICGDDATTGEHLIKHSDLKSQFGKVSQNKPLFLHRDGNLNYKLKTIKRDPLLKSSALICAACNNDRTSDYDRAWEKLSGYLRKKSPAIKSGDIIKLEKIFPGSAKISMLRVHLYFVKLFGCAISAHNVPIDIKPFSFGLLYEKPVNNVYLKFIPSNGMGTGMTNMETANIKDRCAFATWFYVVGNIAVNVMFAVPGEQRQGLRCSWHPSNMSKRVKIGSV